MPTDELAIQAEQLLDEQMAKFPLPHRPTLVWKSLRVTAGIAYYRTNQIGLSRQLLTDFDRLRITLLHEYAHLLAVHRHGRSAANHGPFWQAAMQDLGLPPVRTHNYEVERNTSRQQVTYQCKKCGKSFVRTRRLPKGNRYMHARCGGGLRLISIEKTTNGNIKP